MAPDLIERRIDRTGDEGQRTSGVSLKPTVGVTDPGNVRSRTVMRRGDEPLNVSEVVNGLTDCDGCRDKGWK